MPFWCMKIIYYFPANLVTRTDFFSFMHVRGWNNTARQYFFFFFFFFGGGGGGGAEGVGECSLMNTIFIGFVKPPSSV